MGTLPAGPEADGRRRASAGSYRHGGLKLKYSGIGGQAVLEGIMMKNKDTYATAVRKPDGEIVIQKDTYVSMTEKVKFFSLPFVRGIFSFADSMILGMKTLTWSASFFEDDEEDEAPGRFESFLIDKFGEKWKAIVMTAVIDLFRVHGHRDLYGAPASDSRLFPPVHPVGNGHGSTGGSDPHWDLYRLY